MFNMYYITGNYGVNVEPMFIIEEDSEIADKKMDYLMDVLQDLWWAYDWEKGNVTR